MKARFIVIICLFPVLMSCGISLTYNRLPWLADWYIDDYVSLNDAQEAEFERQFKSWHNWHRRTQLPLYQAQLNELTEEFKQGLNLAGVQRHFRQFEQHWYRIVNYVSPELIAMLKSLQANQKQELLDNLHEKLNEDIEDWQDKRDDESYAERRLDRIQESSEKWLDDLTEAQNQLAEQAAQNYIPTRRMWFDYRRNWLAALETALFEKDTKQFEAQLDLLINEPWRWRSELLQQALQKNRQTSAQLIADLTADLQVDQKSYLLEQLQDYQTTISDLIKD
ncbi:DUF6279 family lipoprotein [Gayadomonas joobiniege]|uniref:DUF6279 family lipoprotein n=1 Tax=Gayadomonas joobiniege TaxID=1234606 RepID=UPI00036EE944|nr:DUF6279 family lipoprotein [Gayadomonas joobiniege]